MIFWDVCDEIYNLVIFEVVNIFSYLRGGEKFVGLLCDIIICNVDIVVFIL